MDPILGLWNTYHRGEISSALEKLFRDLRHRGYQLESQLAGQRSFITNAEDLVTRLKELEQRQGVRSLLELFSAGVEVACTHRNRTQMTIHVLLRVPDRQPGDPADFRSLVANWVENNERTFMDRCFQSAQPLFLHTPLERGLKRRFGFRFQYKILMTHEG